MCSDRISIAPSGLGSTSETASGRFLAGPCRPSGSKGFILRISKQLDAERGMCSHLDLDTEHTLSEQDVSDGIVDVVSSGLTRVDHETVGELHRLGSSSSEFTRDDDLATLGTGLHDESEDTVAGSVP